MFDPFSSLAALSQMFGLVVLLIRTPVPHNMTQYTATHTVSDMSRKNDTGLPICNPYVEEPLPRIALSKLEDGSAHLQAYTSSGLGE